MSKITIIVLDPAEESEISRKLWLHTGAQDFDLKHIQDYTDIDAIDPSQNILFVKAINRNNYKWLENFPKEKFKTFLIFDGKIPDDYLPLLAVGISYILTLDDLDRPEFKDILVNVSQRLGTLQQQGSKRLELQYFEMALSISPDAMIIFDKEKRIIYASDHYRRVYKSFDKAIIQGIPVEEAFELMSKEQEVRPGDPQYGMAKHFWSTLEGTIEITLKNRQTLRVAARKLPHNKGTAVITTNITKYREQQDILELQSQKLESLLKKEQEASAIQNQFISMVSHEFKTPLTIIDGNAQILSRRASEMDTDMIEKRSKTIRSAVSRLISLMEGILSSNMLETGNMKYEPEPFNLQDLIQELCVEQADLTPALIISADLSRVPDTVKLDKKMMTLIISNLLANAVKFAHEDPQIEINGEVRNGMLMLQFSDNGIGIPESEQSRIFERFYRASNTSGITGTGIGLSLVKQLVQIQGGSIKLVSVEGAGTTFYLTFPVNKE